MSSMAVVPVKIPKITPQDMALTNYFFDYVDAHQAAFDEHNQDDDSIEWETIRDHLEGSSVWDIIKYYVTAEAQWRKVRAIYACAHMWDHNPCPNYFPDPVDASQMITCGYLRQLTPCMDRHGKVTTLCQLKCDECTGYTIIRPMTQVERIIQKWTQEKFYGDFDGFVQWCQRNIKLIQHIPGMENVTHIDTYAELYYERHIMTQMDENGWATIDGELYR